MFADRGRLFVFYLNVVAIYIGDRRHWFLRHANGIVLIKETWVREMADEPNWLGLCLHLFRLLFILFAISLSIKRNKILSNTYLCVAAIPLFIIISQSRTAVAPAKSSMGLYELVYKDDSDELCLFLDASCTYYKRLWVWISISSRHSPSNSWMVAVIALRSFTAHH